jgi:predicted ATPase
VFALVRTQFVVEVQLKRQEVPSFDVYPFSLPVVRRMESVEMHPHVTFIVGENGPGKSTLLEAIAVAMGINAEGGSRNFTFATRPTHSELHQYLRVVKGIRGPRDTFFLRAESFYNVATEIERLGAIGYYGGGSLHAQSHGEAFLSLLCDRFRANGLYILDEPEAALSPTRQLTALARIHDLVEQGSQFIIATHSPIIMAYPNAQILWIGDDGVAPVDYIETEHYQVTKQFLVNRESMLRVLMQGADS